MGFWRLVESLIFQGGSLQEFLQFRRGQQLEGLMGIIALNVFNAYEQKHQESAQKSWDTQYNGVDFTVKVQSGYDRDHVCYTTNILVIPRQNNPRGSHQHIVFDEHGNELFNQWREN